MPVRSKVIRMSIVAFGGSVVSLEEEEEAVVVLFGAKASRRRLEIRSVGHVVVIESGKFLEEQWQISIFIS